MKVYFIQNDDDNLITITDGKTAKIFTAAPTGIYEGIDLYEKNTIELLKKHFKNLDTTGNLNDYSNIYSHEETKLTNEFKKELKTAELIFQNDN